MEQPGVVAANLGLRFSLHFLSIFVHISGSIRPITLIWASMERSSSSAEVEHRWCQFGSKVMTSEVEERPRVVTAGYGRHGSQWVKISFIYVFCFMQGRLIFHNQVKQFMFRQSRKTIQSSTFFVTQLGKDSCRFESYTYIHSTVKPHNYISWIIGEVWLCTLFMIRINLHVCTETENEISHKLWKLHYGNVGVDEDLESWFSNIAVILLTWFM